MRFFFYGTLLDPEVRRRVLGEDVRTEPAVLTEYRRVVIAGRNYPALIPTPAGRIDGQLSEPLADAARGLLVAYEGPEYRLSEVTVRAADGATATAMVFLPIIGVSWLDEEWHLEVWQRRHKPQFLRQISRRMTPAS